MVECKRKHVMNLIFNHVRFHPTIKINYIRMKLTSIKYTNTYLCSFQSFGFHNTIKIKIILL